MYNCLDRILTCDRQTDTQTSFHGIVRAMHMHHVVKTDPRSRARSGWTPQFNQFSTVIHCLCLPCSVDIRKFVCDRQTDRQTARITLLCLCRVITQMQTDMDKSHKTKKTYTADKTWPDKLATGKGGGGGTSWLAGTGGGSLVLSSQKPPY